MTLRVPTDALDSAVSSIESLGSVTHRSVSSEDVTEQYIDVEARLKNMIALRDRLRKLLEKATDVKAMLAVEKELSRVQADVDSLEGRFRALKKGVDLATIHLTIRRTRILGPLGYFFKAVWWGVEKLFVIRK